MGTFRGHFHPLANVGLRFRNLGDYRLVAQPKWRMPRAMWEVAQHTGATLVDFAAVGAREIRGGLLYLTKPSAARYRRTWLTRVGKSVFVSGAPIHTPQGFRHAY